MDKLLEEYHQLPTEKQQTFYLENFLEWSLQRIKKSYTQTVNDYNLPQYNILYQPVGTSPVPMVLMILAMEPKEVVFLVSERSREYLDDIVKYAKLSPSRYQTIDIGPSSMVDIYHAIKNHSKGKKGPMAIDVTGGKKVMSAGAALTGAYYDMDIFYLDSTKYDPARRSTGPGSEFVVKIDNPFRVFGDRELYEAVKLCQRYDFTGALGVLRPALKRVSEPQVFELYVNVAEAYRTWDDFNFSETCKNLDRAVKDIDRFRLNQAWKARLQDQLELLRPLQRIDNIAHLDLLVQKKLVWPLIGSIYANALRREEQGRLDFSALLLYRTMEMLSQMRLASWGVSSNRPDYSKLEIPKDMLTSSFKEIQRDLYKDSYVDKALPAVIGLMDGLALLKAIDDPWGRSLDLSAVKNGIDSRNNSILAHGISLVDRKTYGQMKTVVDRALETAWETQPAGEGSWADYIQRFEFVFQDQLLEVDR